MINILKVGDQVYSQSIQHFSNSYISGFPQREQFLLKHCHDIKFDFFKHEILSDIEIIYKEKGRFTEYLDSHRYDYVMVDNPLSSLIIDKKNSIPLLFDCIDWYDEMYLKEFGIDKRYYLLRYGLLHLLEMAEKVIAQSPVILEALKKWGLRTHKTIVIPNGYDKKLFYPFSEKKTEDLKKMYETKYRVSLNGKKIVVYTGKLGKWYNNIKLIAESIENDQIFFVVGDGPILNEIPKRQNVIKCGAVDHDKVPNFTNIADVLVFPVDNDCSPIAISEYLAVGKPIVMGIGRMEWLLKDNITGSMVNNNINAWKAGIKKAIEINDNCRTNNLKLAKELSWQKLSIKLFRFLNEDPS